MQRCNAKAKRHQKVKAHTKGHVVIYGWIQPEMSSILLSSQFFQVIPRSSTYGEEEAWVLRQLIRSRLGLDTTACCLIHHEMSECYVYLSKNQQLLGDFVPQTPYRGFAPGPHCDIHSPGSPSKSLLPTSKHFPRPSTYIMTCLCHYKNVIYWIKAAP
jgi:hypothetical protein